MRWIYLVFLTLSVCLHAQDTAGTGAITGLVKDAGGRPRAAVKVCIDSAADRCVDTDTSGRFRTVTLRPGEYKVLIGNSSTTVEVHAGVDASIEFTIPDMDSVKETVTVTENPFVLPEEIKSSGYLIGQQEVFKSAGTLQDVARYVQTLPGVVTGSDDFRNDIIVRGGSPLENLFIVDNIEIPNINTFANFASAGGTVSMLDPAMLRDVTFLTGGYPAPYGNRTSSVLQIAQREGARDGIHGRASVLFSGAGLLLEGPWAKGKGSWILSARRSFLDLFTKDTGIGGVPVLYTYNAKASYDASPTDRLWVVNLSGVDSIRLGLTEKNRNDTEDEINNVDAKYSGWRSASGFNWQKLFGTRGVGLLGFSHAEARVNSSFRDLVRNGVPPDSLAVDQIIANSPVVFREDSREGETTLKYDLTWTSLPVVNKVQAGSSSKLFQVRYDTASPFGNDTPWSPVAGISPFSLKRSFSAAQGGGYAQATRDLGRRVNVTFGGRADRFAYIDQARFSPRAALSVRITDRLSWRASYGQYFQQPFLLFLAAFDVNRGLVPFRADHMITGFSYSLRPGLRVSVEAYRKLYKDYPSARDIPQLSVANLGDTFIVRDILFPLTSAGRGRSQGIEFFIEKKGTGRWFGQANLALTSTRHAGTDGVYRPGAFDYRRVFNAIGGYRLSQRWELASRLLYLSGRPYPPFDTAASVAQNRGVYNLDRINLERLPAYFRVDIRLDRTFTVRDKPLLVFLGVQNITNRENVASVQFNRRTKSVQQNEQPGLFPLVGMEWRF